MRDSIQILWRCHGDFLFEISHNFPCIIMRLYHHPILVVVSLFSICRKNCETVFNVVSRRRRLTNSKINSMPSFFLLLEAKLIDVQNYDLYISHSRPSHPTSISYLKTFSYERGISRWAGKIRKMTYMPWNLYFSSPSLPSHFSSYLHDMAECALVLLWSTIRTTWDKILMVRWVYFTI